MEILLLFVVNICVTCCCGFYLPIGIANKLHHRQNLDIPFCRRNLFLKEFAQSNESEVEILKKIVTFGIVNYPKYEMNGEGERVPGCTATVSLSVNIASNYTLLFRGNADSLVAKGILAAIIQEWNGRLVADLVNTDPDEWFDTSISNSNLSSARKFGIRNVFNLMRRLAVSRRKQTQYVSELPSNGNILMANESRAIIPATFDGQNYPDDRDASVAVLLSGGVDSSVALKLLQIRGYRNITAYYIKIWLEDEMSHLNQCPWEEDLKYAEAVCQQLQVPLRVISLQDMYWNKVVNYTLNEARRGRTPNPDIMCNSMIKFGVFYDRVGHLYERVATGHYARLSTNGTSVALRTAVDTKKDQTYFLSHLQQPQLQRVLLPVGDYTKHEIRQLASEHNLATAARKDSQGICFLGKLKFGDFLKHYLGKNPGMIRDAQTGEEIGRHSGLWYHTIGQRKGVGPLLYSKHSCRGPWIVAGKKMEANELWVTRSANMCITERQNSTFFVDNVNWIAGETPVAASGLQIKVRHGPEYHTGSLHGPLISVGSYHTQDKLIWKVVLNSVDAGLAPGQFTAFYNDSICLGSGTIREAEDQALYYQEKCQYF